jgi:hypothetical protein
VGAERGSIERIIVDGHRHGLCPRAVAVVLDVVRDIPRSDVVEWPVGQILKGPLTLDTPSVLCSANRSLFDTARSRMIARIGPIVLKLDHAISERHL